MGSEGFKKFCRGNALKYLIRADRKGGVEDLQKAMVYITWEIETDGEKSKDAVNELKTNAAAEPAEPCGEQTTMRGGVERKLTWDAGKRSDTGI